MTPDPDGATPSGDGGVREGGAGASGSARPVEGPASPGSGPSSSRGGPPVPSGELERVIRRAVELQMETGAGTGPASSAGEALTEEEVLRIGREVGLEPRHVRRALAEVRAESLLPDLPADEGVPNRLWGGAFARASRAVPGDPAEVQGELEEHFREAESLQAIRSRPGRSLWEPAGGLVNKMQRTLDVGGHGYELAEGRRVELSVTELEAGWSLVTVTVDLRNLRTEQAVGWAGGASGVAVPMVLVGALVLGLPVEALLPAAAGGIGGASVLGGRYTLTKKRRRVELVLEGLLDRVETGEPLGSDQSSWRERLLGG